MSGEKASMVGLMPGVEASDAQCPDGGRRRSNAWEIAPDELCTNDSANESIISGICNMLGEKKKELSSEMEELKIAEKSCRAALAILHREEVAWRSKLDAIKKKLVNASTRKKEASLMLKLHETLEKSGSLSGTVRTVQGILTEDIPVDMKVMVSDCFNEQHTANTKECVVCLSSFTAEDLLSASKSDRCRHTLYPCGHSAVCGMCAKHLWETTRKCPLCRATFTKRPKIFRPGRQQ